MARIVRLKTTADSDTASPGQTRREFPDRFLTKKDVAALLQLCPRSVDNLCKAGLPRLAIGSRRLRFDMEEIRAWLRERYGTRHGSNGNGGMRKPPGGQ
jgi:predicted DNA-binding transcriptional regulator AlpA